MNFKFNLIFVGFVINFSNGCSSKTSEIPAEQDNPTKPIRPVDGVWFNRSEVSKMSSMDAFNLHHAFTIPSMIWRDGQVNFEIDEAFNEFESISLVTAMEEIQNFTCISFVPFESGSHQHFVKIHKDFDSLDRAESVVGCHHKGQQDIWLGFHRLYYSDYQYVIRHALLQTLGFFEHHMRSDRDEYLEFHMENTNLNASEIALNFVKIVELDPEVQLLTPFDFYSVMLSDPSYITTTSDYAITSKIEGMKIPGHNEKPILSKSDKILINKFYNCPDN